MRPARTGNPIVKPAPGQDHGLCHDAHAKEQIERHNRLVAMPEESVEQREKE